MIHALDEAWDAQAARTVLHCLYYLRSLSGHQCDLKKNNYTAPGRHTLDLGIDPDLDPW